MIYKKSWKKSQKRVKYILEKYWKVGGYLDIYVTDTTGKGYLMIECKQYGKAYNEAKKIILTNNYKKYVNKKNQKKKFKGFDSRGVFKITLNYLSPPCKTTNIMLTYRW